MSSDGGLGGLLGNLFGGKDGGGIGKVLQDLLGGKTPDATGASDKVNIPTPENPPGPLQPPNGRPGAVAAGPQPGQVQTGPRPGTPTPGTTQPQYGGQQPGTPQTQQPGMAQGQQPGMAQGRQAGTPQGGPQYGQPQSGQQQAQPGMSNPQPGQPGLQPPQAPRPQAPQMPQAPQIPQPPQMSQGGTGAMAGAVAGGAATGLDSLLDRLRKAGLGDQVTSWLSDGPNKTIDPQQISQAVGPQQLSNLAKTAGVSPDEVAQGLAKALPQVVNEMTPHGQIPDASQVQNTINRLFG